MARNRNDYKIFKSSMYLKKERTHGAFCDERLGGGHKHIVSNVEEVGEGIKLDDEGEGVNYSLAMDAIDTARPIFSGSEGLDKRVRANPLLRMMLLCITILLLQPALRVAFTKKTQRLHH